MFEQKSAARSFFKLAKISIDSPGQQIYERDRHKIQLIVSSFKNNNAREGEIEIKKNIKTTKNAAKPNKRYATTNYY